MPSRLCKLLKPFLWILLLPSFPLQVGAQDAELRSLDEAPAIRQRIREERQTGNAEAAWNLEQALLALAAQNPENVRSGRILSDAGDFRLDMLSRYTAGDPVPEIELGCYYTQGAQHIDVSRRGSQSLMAGGSLDTRSCAAGSSYNATRALSEEIRVLYVESARILRRSAGATDDEVRDIHVKALAASYRVLDYPTGRANLEALLQYQEAKSASSVARAETLALIGDWDMLFAEHFGNKYVASAADTYERAIALLTENGAAQNAVDSIFAPATPILLPAFGVSPLKTQPTGNADGYVDVAFEIRKSGKSARVDIVDSSEGVERSAEREVVNTIKFGRFRPRAANGQLLGSAPVTARYYIGD